MLYAQLLFIYLLLIVMWLSFAEIWFKKVEMILSLTLVMNSLKGNITRTFSQWFKGLMGMRVSLRNRDRALTYYAARDFVHLTFEQKFNVGFQLGLCDHYDAMQEEEFLEELIFKKAVNDRVLDQFMATVRRIKHDE